MQDKWQTDYTTWSMANSTCVYMVVKFYMKAFIMRPGPASNITFSDLHKGFWYLLSAGSVV